MELLILIGTKVHKGLSVHLQHIIHIFKTIWLIMKLYENMSH